MAKNGSKSSGRGRRVHTMDGKRQEILIEAVPELRRMAALADANATGSPQLQALQDAAYARNIELSIHRIASAEEDESIEQQRESIMPVRIFCVQGHKLIGELESEINNRQKHKLQSLCNTYIYRYDRA